VVIYSKEKEEGRGGKREKEEGRGGKREK